MTSVAAKWSKRIGTTVLVLVTLLLIWGSLIEPRLIEERSHEVSIPHLPPMLDGIEIAVIADLQVGMWGANIGTIERIVQRLVDDEPAAVLIAGDFVYQADDRLDEIVGDAVQLLRPLTAAGIPTFAVLGNHDYSLDREDGTINHRVARALEAALEAIGVRVLENEAAPIAPIPDGEETQPLYVVGIGDVWADASEPVEAVGAVPHDAPRVVFMHNPRSFPELPAETAPLAVAGHTHGGQISVPLTPHWNWMSLIKDEHIEANGWAQDSEEPPGNRLYVNVGIGFSSIPVRINSTPELTRFTLRAPRER